MAKRQPKPEPFSIAELEEIAQSPALQGFEKVLQYRPVLVSALTSTVEDAIASTVEEAVSTTVDGNPTTTVVDTPTSTVYRTTSAHGRGEPLWVAEGAAGVFTASRVRRIERAQDALTHIEEAVYDALWGAKRPNPEPYRLSQMGYSELAKRSRVSKRSIQSVIDRLIEKRFIEVEMPADISTRTSTLYRVLGYGTVLKSLRDTDRLHVLRTGRGVFYARRMEPRTVEADIPSTAEARAASTVEARAPSTVEATSPTTVEASSTYKTLGNFLIGKTSSSVSTVASRIVKLMPIDDDAVRRLIVSCQQTDPEASDDEIAHCAELWIHQNAKNTSIRKPVAVMLTAVPKFFEPPGTELNRYRQEKRREAEESREVARQMLADPDTPEESRAWARSVLGPMSDDEDNGVRDGQTAASQPDRSTTAIRD